MLRAVFVLSLTVLFALPAAAQDLDGTWYKLKVKARGQSVSGGVILADAEGEVPVEIKKATFKADAWMFLEFDIEAAEGGFGTYTATVVTEVEPGVFDVAIDDTFGAFGDVLLFGGFLGFITPDGAVGAATTLQFKNKFDKEGALKKSSFKAIGANVEDSTLFLPEEGIGLAFFGGMTVKGKSVKLEKLPFDPGEVLGGGMLKNAAVKAGPWKQTAK